MSSFFTRLLFLLSICLVLASELWASHSAGGQITYTSLGNNLYRFRLAYFRDCAGITPGTQSLTWNGCGQTGTITLTLVANTPASPNPREAREGICGSVVTSCGDPNSTFPGFEAYFYEGTATLPAGCANITVNNSDCCRNTQIGNLANPGSAGSYIEAIINNSNGLNNNSAQFARDPTPYFCINSNVSYSNFATDVDGDQLVYSLVQPRSAATTNINYAAPFTLANPLPTAAGGPVTIDPATGVVTFIPNTQGTYVITIQVQEFRNGVLVGVTNRDVQFAIVSCAAVPSPVPTPPVVPPGAASVLTVPGGSLLINACAGDMVDFSFSATVPNATGSTLTVTSDNNIVLPSSTLTVTGAAPTINTSFQWSSAGAQPGQYVFNLNVENQACPLASVVNIPVVINVSRLDATPDRAEICGGNRNVIQLSANGFGGASAPGTYTWTPTTGLSNPNIFNPVATISQPLTYTVTYQSGVCIQRDQVIITAPYTVNLPVIRDTTICGGVGSAILDATIPAGPPTFQFPFLNAPGTIVRPATAGTTDTTEFIIPVTGMYPPNFTAAGNVFNSVNFTINQPRPNALTVALITPSGSRIVLTSGRGGTGTTGAAATYTNTTFVATPTQAGVTSISSLSPFGAVPANATYLPLNGNSLNLTTGPVNGNWILQIIHNNSTVANGVLQNATLSLNNTLSPIYEWTPNTNLSSATASVVTATPPATTQYQVIAYNLAGCRDTATATVFIQNALPTPVVSCAGSTLNSVSFDWQAVGGAAAYEVSVGSPTGPFTNVGTNTTFTVTTTTATVLYVRALTPPGSLCAGSAVGNTTCTPGSCPIITPTIVGNSFVCEGNTISLVANATGGSGPYTFEWSSASLAANVQNQNLTRTNATTAMSGQYTVLASDNNGCQGSALLNLTVGTIVPNITGNAPVCQGGTVRLDAGANYQSYAWSNGGGTGRFANYNTSGTQTVTVTDNNGCVGTVSANVTVNNNPIPNISGSTSICNGASTQLDGGAGFATYRWSTGSTAQVLTASTAGTYSLTVTDINGCTGTTSVQVIQSASLQPNITGGGALTFCAGGSVVLDAGNFSSYIWSTGANTRTVSVNTSGVLNVTVGAVNGCTGTDQITVTVNPLPQVELGTDLGICLGSLAVIEATVTGGANPFTFNWDNGLGNAASHSVAPSATTQYNLTVTDSNNCSATDDVTVNIFGSPSIVATALDSDICNGESTTLDAMVIGGAAPYNFIWDNGLAPVSNPLVSPSTTTSYNVFVVDGNGCNGSAQVTVNVNSPLSASIAGATSVCAGVSTRLSANVSGGTPVYSYAWSNGQATPFVDVVPTTVSIFTVTVTDALPFGCTAVSSITVTPASSLSTNIQTSSNRNSICPSEFITLDAGSFNSYAWSNGQNSRTIAINQPGTYTVSISDISGCTGTGIVTITEFSAPTATAGAAQSICANACATLQGNASGGAGGYSFAWANLSPGQVVTDCPTSTTSYILLVTDANGCTASDNTTVNVTNGPFLTVSTTDQEICLNTSTTLLALVNGGVAPLTFAWSNSATVTTSSQIVAPQNNTTYSVSVVDNIGCSATGQITVQVTPIPSPTINSSSPQGGLFCAGNNVTMTASAGFNSYVWSTPAPNNTSQSVVVNQSGAYRVTVTDNTGCQGVATYLVDALPPIVVSVSTDSVTCRGDSTGVAVVNRITGGNGNYILYQWSNGVSGSTTAAVRIDSLLAGRYDLTVTDGLGCTGVNSVVVHQPLDVLSTGALFLTDPTCHGTANGAATINPTGGTAPYQFAWSNNQFDQAVVNLEANVTHSVTVLDARGCLHDTSFVMAEPDPVGLVITPNSVFPANCARSADGRATVIASGGTPYPNGTYTYQWTSNEVTAIATALRAGNNYVTVVDANGCIGVDNVFTTAPNEIVGLATNVSPTSCNGSATGQVTLLMSGGTAPYNFAWGVGGSLQTSQTATGLAAGRYFVTVTDLNGCTAQVVAVIPSAAGLMSERSLTTPILCNGDATAGVSLTITGGASPYTVTWDNGVTVTGNAVSGLTAGTYTATITDSNGCSMTDQVTINEPTAATLTDVSIPVRCFGESNGTLRVSVTGGTMPYRYSLDLLNPYRANNGLFPGMPAGNYTFYVSDANGCTSTLAVTLTEPVQPTLTVTPSTTVEFGNPLRLSAVPSGIPNPTVLWLPPSNLDNSTSFTPLLNPIQDETFIVSVTGSDGCATTATVEVTIQVFRRVYVPNLFSPNGDSRNDSFRPECGNGVSKINYFRVYDRWGEKVYELLNADVTSNAHQGWNGKYNGQLMNSQVFGWHAEIVYSDGKVEAIRGEVTLMR